MTLTQAGQHMWLAISLQLAIRNMLPLQDELIVTLLVAIQNYNLYSKLSNDVL